jgi:hypothetical protein
MVGFGLDNQATDAVDKKLGPEQCRADEAGVVLQ